jgi:hypothetical protein
MTFAVKSKKTGTEYFLHGNKMPNGATLYYFSKAVNADKALEAIPAGYEVSENPATGLPILKKIK